MILVSMFRKKNCPQEYMTSFMIIAALHVYVLGARLSGHLQALIFFLTPM